ncbi:MAG TPA: hypothetical protein VE687_11005 [Stellaceae bacterium]|nr:hypothetical protein [Stellaceae bacterium]
MSEPNLRQPGDLRRHQLSRRTKSRRANRLDFGAINRTGIAILPALLARWLPGGRVEGSEYAALNPRRSDRCLGSFKINLKTGLWADFACDDAAGSDPISLAAYLFGLSQSEAAKRLAVMLGIEANHGG